MTFNGQDRTGGALDLHLRRSQQAMLRDEVAMILSGCALASFLRLCCPQVKLVDSHFALMITDRQVPSGSLFDQGVAALRNTAGPSVERTAVLVGTASPASDVGGPVLTSKRGW